MRADSSDPATPNFTPIDFARPASLDDGQIESVRNMHESFAYLTAQTVQRLALADQVECRLTSVEQMLLHEYRAGLPNSGIFSFIRMDPLPSGAIFELERALAFILLDRYLGGTGDVEIPEREPSEFEFFLIETLVIYLLGNLRESWSPVIDLRPRLGNLETTPETFPVAPEDEITVIVSFDLQIDGRHGTMNFVFPRECFKDLELNPRKHYYNRSSDKIFGGDIARDTRVRTFREFPVVRTTTYAAVQTLEPGQSVTIVTDNESRTLYTARLESYEKMSYEHPQEELP